MVEAKKMRSSELSAIACLPHLNYLLPLLRRLDQYLAQAIATVEVNWGSEAPMTLYQGLRTNLEEVGRSLGNLNQGNGLPVKATSSAEQLADFVVEGSPLARLQQAFNLTAFDLDAIALVLAPELDRRYERLYACLQGNERCKQPSVALALNLLCPTTTGKLSQRDRFSPGASLIRHKLLYLTSDPSQSQPSLLAQNLLLDEQIAHFLLGERGLDSRLAPICQLLEPAASCQNLRWDESTKKALRAVILQSQQRQQPLRLYFQGRDRNGKRAAAEALAAELHAPLLVADLAFILAGIDGLELTLNTFKLILRQAWLDRALLYLDSLDSLQGEERVIFYESLLSAIAQTEGIIILAGEQSWKPGTDCALGTLTVPFSVPDFALRRLQWQECLAGVGISLAETDLDALSDRFRLTSNQIADAVATACNSARWQAATGEQASISELLSSHHASILFAAARAQGGHDLAVQARKIEPKYNWEDIVLPEDPRTQLREICNQAKYRYFVYQKWGFERKLSLGKGQNVLFSGPPGTGKTMAAEVIANELQLDLYKIDLSQVVSKYIGETEKNLNRIFNAAASSNAILFFDEADSLFGKRTEVKEARDRYANIEVGYLLQKMEEYEGIAILTTNARSNIDDAFVRRLRFIVEFTLPNEKQRRQIWEKIWPDSTPRSADIDLNLLARKLEITGANIRNIALAAAFLAAADGEVVSMNHLSRATQREYQKMGKILMQELS